MASDTRATSSDTQPKEEHRRNMARLREVMAGDEYRLIRLAARADVDPIPVSPETLRLVLGCAESIERSEGKITCHWCRALVEGEEAIGEHILACEASPAVKRIKALELAVATPASGGHCCGCAVLGETCGECLEGDDAA